MQLNKATLASANRGFQTVFNMALASMTTTYGLVAMDSPSSSSEEEYKWLGHLPRMREWLGERVVKNLTAHGYTIKNRDFEGTVGVDRNDFEDDKLGLYRPLFASLGEEAARHPDDLVWALLPKGFTEKGFDGVEFFSAAHKVGDTTRSNKGTKKLKADGVAYASARAAMMSLTDDQGRPLRIMPNLLVVSPSLEGVGRQLLTADVIDNATNPWKGTAELHVEPQLAGNPTQWFLMSRRGMLRPLIWQRRTRPQLVPRINGNDDNVFWEKQLIWGVDYRGNAGYGLWQLAYGSTGADE